MLAKGLIIGLFVMGIAAFFYFDLGQVVTLKSLKSNKDAFRSYAEVNYLLMVVLYIAAYALQTALSLPGATIFTISGGFLFGSLLGTLYVNIAATAGASLAFLAARYLFRDTVEKKLGKKLGSFQKGFSENAFSYLLTLRLIPLFPFFLVNLASGLTRIRLTTYMAATSIGILPGSFVFSNAGKQLGNIDSVKDIASIEVLGSFALLGVLSLIPVIYKKLKKPAIVQPEAPLK
jgi:uncharacterized membrane protein YdjX (TVP38/TMEM64 family)